MRRSQFVHAAGLRLGEPFRGVGRIPPKVRAALADAPLAAWDELVDFCIQKDVAFLVVAGGVCGPCGITLAGRLRLHRGLKRLAEHGTRTFLALGPADGEIAALLSDLRETDVTIFPFDSPASFRVERRGEAIALVCGQSAHGDLEFQCADFLTTATEDLPRIAVLPAGVGDLERHPEALRRRASYWALGAASHPSRRGFSPWIVECGSLQARASEPTERGPRGAMLVSLDGNRVLAVDHVPLDRVRFAELSIAPSYALADALLLHQLMDEMNRLRATHSGRALVVDTIVRSGAPGDWMAAHAEAHQLLARLRDETAAWDPLVWCSSIRVEAPIRSASGRGNAPIAQAILQESRALLANPLQRSYFFAKHFDPLMRRCTSEFDTGDAEGLIAAATELALQHACEDRAD